MDKRALRDGWQRTKRGHRVKKRWQGIKGEWERGWKGLKRELCKG